MIDEQLEKINKYTRRQLTEDEVYIFTAVLCDNDIDRDGECFSDNALEELQKLFIGKTGISDHDPQSCNQNARIFDTEITEDSSRRTKNGNIYKCLKASAYMVRTDDNRSLIEEIDGGIKKEVSISCTASKRLCSICGCDKSKTACAHVKGSVYNGKECYTILDGITDAYEWSFVAVPAQVNAGVTKKHTAENTAEKAYADSAVNDEALRREIRRQAFFSGGKAAADCISASALEMNTQQLIDLKKSLEAGNRTSKGVHIQLMPEKTEDDSTAEYSMK